ncbi:MAG: kynureninase [Phycisphaerales bacterium]
MPPTDRRPIFDPAEADALERADPVPSRRHLFHIPKAHDGHEQVYLCGNSLGLQPRTVRDMLNKHLDDWSGLAVEGHFEGHDPWKPYHEWFAGPLSRLVGAHEDEVVAMNSLTVNLHLLMASFYRPTNGRFKILMELPAFPSDVYAVKSQLRFHGVDEAAGLVAVTPRVGESTWRTEDIVETIAREGESLALVMLPGVNYVTGQVFDIEAITRAAHGVGAIAGWDLAHAAGNIPLKLHEWGADFAAWCSYKYLNAGPGAIAGAFVHRRWWTGDRATTFPAMPRFEGWWGNNKETRFRMSPSFDPIRGVEAWSHSNPPIFSLVPVKASLRVFDELGIENLRTRSIRLKGYLEKLLNAVLQARPSGAAPAFEIVTPSDPARRGAQLSLRFPKDARATLDRLAGAGIMCDFRDPDIIRAAPTPLYNTYEDCRRLAEALAGANP